MTTGENTYTAMPTLAEIFSGAPTPDRGLGYGDTKMVGRRETDMKTDLNTHCDGGPWRTGQDGRHYASMPHSAGKLSMETLI